MSTSSDYYGSWWDREYDDAWSLTRLLGELGEAFENLPALIVERPGSVSLTHGEIARLGSALRGAIVGKAGSSQGVIACLTSHSHSSYLALYAVLTSGRAIAMLEPGSAVDRNSQLLRECGAELIVTDRSTQTKAEEIADGSVPVLVQEEAADGDAIPIIPANATDAAVLIFTSGSSGQPQAVVRTHRDLTHAAYCFSQKTRIDRSDVVLNPGAPGHISTVNTALLCMLGGCTSIPIDVSRVSISGVVHLLAAHRVTVLDLSPSLLRLLLPALSGGTELDALRFVWASGAPLSRGDVGRLYNVFSEDVELWQSFGSTETGPIYFGRYSSSDAKGEGPLPLTEPAHACLVEVVSESGEKLGLDQIGNIVVRTPYLARGYMDAAPQEAGRFSEDESSRKFMIGDRGRLSRDGTLSLYGRGDRQISIHGRRIELGTIESSLLNSPGVLEAVATQLSIQAADPTLVAFIQPMPGRTIDPVELRRHLADKLSAEAIPRRLVVVKDMPRTASGKVDRPRLFETETAKFGRIVTGEGGPPRGLAENYLADCWQTVLGVDRPGRGDRFDDLGGDSLAAIELSLMLEKRFGIRIPLDRFLELQTISAQLGAVTASEESEPAVLVQLRDDGDGPVVILFPGAAAHAWVYADLCQLLAVQGTFFGMSYPSLLGAVKQPPSRSDIAQFAAAEAQALVASRPLVLVGYSLGGLIACDVAKALKSLGAAPLILLLLDPVEATHTGLKRRLRRQIKTLVKNIRPAKWNERRSIAARRFEAEMSARMDVLAGIYRSARFVSPGVSTAALVTKSVWGRMGESLGSFVNRQDVQIVDEHHLAILRRPWVGHTAAWIDSKLSEVASSVPREAPRA